MAESTIKTVEVDGYKLTVDMDALDDVRFLEMADREVSQPSVIIEMLKLVVGENGYKDMESYFVKKEGKLRISTIRKSFDKLLSVYDPKESASTKSENDTQTN